MIKFIESRVEECFCRENSIQPIWPTENIEGITVLYLTG